ncbi:MAG: methyltransferase domain-containing protein [Candidatus Micrarchaeia archaeon]|jgi:SAM-dependent methyltransferase
MAIERGAKGAHSDQMRVKRSPLRGAVARQLLGSKRGEYAKPGLRHGYESARMLSEVNSAHARDLEKIVAGLARRFKASKERPLRVLDIGAREGPFLHELKLKFGDKIHAVGMDVTRRHEWEYYPDVEYRVGHALRLSKMFPKPEDRFHLVVSTYGGLYYSLDSGRALREALKVTVPQGRVLAHLPPKDNPIIEANWTGEPLKDVLKGHYATNMENSYQILKGVRRAPKRKSG